jgi:hypothetical protein
LRWNCGLTRLKRCATLLVLHIEFLITPCVLRTHLQHLEHPSESVRIAPKPARKMMTQPNALAVRIFLILAHLILMCYSYWGGRARLSA